MSQTTETTPVRDAGWIPCRRCQGTGTASFKRQNGEDGTGPCFLCEGTGDGRIRNRSGFGPRRGNWKRGNGNWIVRKDGEITSGAESESAGDDTESDDYDDTSEAAAPILPAIPLTAAEHLAAAMAAMQQSAPMDADAVRAIMANDMQGMINKLERTIDQAVSSRAMLAEAIAGIPRRLTIVVGDHMGQLPAMRHPLTDELVQYVAQNIPVYLVGPAGSGKTTAAHQAADALGLPFYLQGAMSGSHEILGFVDAHGRYQTTPWRQAYEHGGVILLDELDGSDPAALMAAHPGISNGHMSFPDQAAPVARHPDFRLIAAANTFGNGPDRLYVGTNQLNAATLDRYAFIDWGYDETLERQLAGNDDWVSFVQSVRRAVSKLQIRQVISPRASMMGATMLAAGMPRDRVEAAFIWKGMSAADIARVRGAL